MPTIAQLNATHPSCDEARTKRLDALYRGGVAFEAMISEFLPQRQQEPSARYALRKRESCYRNYVGPVIDYFASMLFSARVVVEEEGESTGAIDEFYSRFREDADGLGADLDAVFKAAITSAMVVRRAWVRVLHPDGEAADRAEFETRGLGDCWLQLLTEQVLDWEHDAQGRLAWAVVRTERVARESLDAGRDWIVVRWEHLLADRVDVYEIRYRKDSPPNHEQPVPLVSSVPHRFGAVPIVELCLAPALHVAGRLESPQLAHYRLSNAQLWGLTATCYAMPVFKVKDPEEFQRSALGAGYGWVIQPDEEIAWTAPAIAPYEALGAEVKAHKDEIFRIVHQMALGVDNNSAAVGRSADSKLADAESTRVVLQSFAAVVRDAIERVYDLVASARGDKIRWSIGGLDDFAALDVAGMIESLGMLKQQVGGIPSRTWNALMNRRIAESMLRDLDEETKIRIRAEIDENTPDPQDEAMSELVELHRIAQGMNGKDQGGDRGPSGGEPARAAPGGSRGAPAPAKAS